MNRDNQKGISIFLVVIMTSIFLAIVLGLTSIIVGGSKMAESFGDSTKAFHAADTGVEQALYRIRQQSNCDNFTGTIDTGYSYSVVITYSGATCASFGTTINSVGTYNNIKRELEVSY